MNISILQKFLEDNKLAKVDIILKSGISKGTLDNLLQGKDVKISTVESVCRVLGISPAVLFTDDDAAASSTAVINSANSNAAGRDVSIIHQASSEEAALLRRLCDEKDERIKELKERIEELKQMLHTALAK